MLEHMADYAQSPYAGIRYFESVQRTLGKAETAEFARLYTAPGVDHVGSGAPANVDMLIVLVDWVEKGKAPEHARGGRAEGRGAVVRNSPRASTLPVARLAAFSLRPGECRRQFYLRALRREADRSRFPSWPACPGHPHLSVCRKPRRGCPAQGPGMTSQRQCKRVGWAARRMGERSDTHRNVSSMSVALDLILRSLRSKRHEGWPQTPASRPSFETPAARGFSARRMGRAKRNLTQRPRPCRWVTVSSHAPYALTDLNTGQLSRRTRTKKPTSSLWQTRARHAEESSTARSGALAPN